MRGTLPLLSRVPGASDPSRARSPSPALSTTATPPPPIPTIRLISATPAATGSATGLNTSIANTIFASSFVNVPAVSSPLAPKGEDKGSAKRRLVPKKSKLSLLVGGSTSGSNKTKDRANKDLSDVVRRVGGSASTSRGGFEIYVDPTNDPDIGEILMVKKKKSRAALDGMKWGPLGEVTNVPSAPKENGKPSAGNLLKVKTEEKEKWWSIGRGRKDSKEKAKDKVRGRSASRGRPLNPVENENTVPRGRFNSLDSGVLLSSPPAEVPTFGTVSSANTPQVPAIPSSIPNTPIDGTSPTFLAPPPGAPNPGTGSIAIRAMRSMRSMARISSWAQLKPTEKEMASIPALPKKKEKEKEKPESKKKKKKEKEERAQTVRYSGSSFEAGAPTSPEAMTFREALTFREAMTLPDSEAQAQTHTLTKRKHSILGLGLPTAIKFGTARPASVASSMGAQPAAGASRLSVGSSITPTANGRGRSSSTLSAGSSLRPMSTSSGGSGGSGKSSSSAASVRWDEERLETVKERRNVERGGVETASGAVNKNKETEGQKAKDTRRTSESRRRAALADIFPEQMSRPSSQVSASTTSSVPMPHPIVTVEEATADGHSVDDDQDALPYQTPVRRARARPVSEQMLGRSRPKAICDDDGDGVLSILDAATNDLASLINRLDLQATPATPDGSPLRLSPYLSSRLGGSMRATASPLSNGSPVKKPAAVTGSPVNPGLRTNMASVTSLRPYAQSRSRTLISGAVPSSGWGAIGKQIAPWPISPTKLSPKRTPKPSAPSFRQTHKRTLSPAPQPEEPIVFQPLRPAKPKGPVALMAATPSPPPATAFLTPLCNAEPSTPSSRTFGSRPFKMSGPIFMEERDEAPTPTPVFRRPTNGEDRQILVDLKGSVASMQQSLPRVTLSPEAKKGLGMAGTLGGSLESLGEVGDDPDSDIPDELQVILSGQEDGDTDFFDDTLSFRPDMASKPPPSPGLPPASPLPTPEPSFLEPESPIAPVFHAQLIDDDENHTDIDGSDSSDDDTKKSFDFTGELRALNESGASERRSFVEQLENAFRTPTKFALDQFGHFNSTLDIEIPPVPPLPSQFVEHSTLSIAAQSPSSDSSVAEQPSDIPTPDITELRPDVDDSLMYELSPPKRRVSNVSKPSDGQLDVNFRFGGKRSTSNSTLSSDDKPLTLSDIIPSPAHARRISMSLSLEEDSSVLKSIFAQAVDLPQSLPRRRVNSDSSSKRFLRDQARANQTFSYHSRASSQASFSGFEFFGEVRRGFEFNSNRPAFYPPPSSSRRGHNKHESFFSIASVSSYGDVINPGSHDPFEYGVPALPKRYSYDDMSLTMSTSIDDTFDFINRDNRRKRVDSDASSFYFRIPGRNQMLQPLKRSHRQRDSVMSVASIAPPVSLYNRSFGGHRRNDSASSASSVAQAYAMYGTAGARASWASHRQDYSIDSVMSDMSAMRLGRPGLGDKMLESAAHDYGMPLTAISASPPESVSGDRIGNNTSYDSIIDDERRFSTEDSIFQKTEYRSSADSESLFGQDQSYPLRGLFQPGQFRPISMMSMEQSVHGPEREDDTMITMLDGAHVRRLSVNSAVEGSPCFRVGKRKHGNARGPQQRVVDIKEENLDESPAKARLIERPSIASASSYQFGGERMIMARKGLLERQSLEENVLIAEGQDLSFLAGPVFGRPGHSPSPRSSTYTDSSGAETPPLSISDGSSQSSGSQSSIDIAKLNSILTNITHPMTGHARNPIRARARGQGHRRRLSQVDPSRSSVYETIQEENVSAQKSPVPSRLLPERTMLSPVRDDVVVVEADIESGYWDDDRGVLALRKYFALRDEAHDTVEESKRTWIDTPFSIYALQSFEPPAHTAGIQAMLEHSQQTYGPLSSELRPRRFRSRTHSRPSPYPRVVERSPAVVRSADHSSPPVPSLLQDRTANYNIANVEVSPFVPAKNDLKSIIGLPPRPRVGSNARRTALGWTKRSTGRENKESKGKENKENVSYGSIATPSETLRLSRPRPRGRPTPHARAQAVRV